MKQLADLPVGHADYLCERQILRHNYPYPCKFRNMAKEDPVQKAIEIGERNKEVIELATNWCAHLEVRQSGGIGLVEIQTGLPIGMRSFKCRYATAAGLAGMDLETVALDFYDRNCADCKQRQPVRLPNLSSLVAERDEAQRRASQDRALFAQKEAEALAARAARRAELSRGCDPARAGIFSVLDALDRDPNDHNRQLVIATSKAGAQYFDTSVLEALYDLASAGGFHRSETALEVLAATPADAHRCCAIALELLARHEGHGVAGNIVANHLSRDHEALVPGALPAIIALAAPVDGMFPGSGSPGDPAPLLSAFRLFPDSVLPAIQDHLRQPEKYVRIRACHAISRILQLDTAFGTKVVDDLIRSLALPDDPYGHYGAAEHNVAHTLADIMVNHPELVDARIQAEMQTVSEDERSELFAVYERILRMDFQDDRTSYLPPPRAVQISYQRFVEVLSQRAENELLQKAIWFLRHESLRFLDVLEHHAETLLGAAALIAADLEVPQSPLADLSLTPDPLRQLEAQGRRQTLYTTLEAVLKPIGALAGKKPDSIGTLLLKTFDGLGDEHRYLKAGLVRALGHMAASPAASKLVLPALYQAMTSQSPMVRAASAEAYGKMAENDPDDLPSLVHETFLLLLVDPYVVVHTAAIDALQTIDIPAQFSQRVLAGLATIIGAYDKSHSDDHLLAESLEQFLGLRAQGNRSPIDAATGKRVLTILANMKVYESARFIAHNGRYLRGIAGYGQLVLKLLGDADLDDYQVDDLVDELSHVDRAEILATANSFRAVAATRAQAGQRRAEEFIEILTNAGVWSVASEIALDSAERFDDTIWDRPAKLRTKSLHTATALEQAAAEADSDRVIQLAEQWRSLEKAIKEDDEQNKKRRDPLFGIPIPDKGN